MSTSEIGRQLGVGKNSALSKAHRIGLPGREPIIDADKARKTRAEKREFGAAVTGAQAERAPALVAGPRGCRFPLWNDKESPTHEYCGGKVRDGRVYCDSHHARTHLKLTYARNDVKPLGTRY